jgi:hypothetical protein
MGQTRGKNSKPRGGRTHFGMQGEAVARPAAAPRIKVFCFILGSERVTVVGESRGKSKDGRNERGCEEGSEDSSMTTLDQQESRHHLPRARRRVIYHRAVCAELMTPTLLTTAPWCMPRPCCERGHQLLFLEKSTPGRGPSSACVA